MKVKFVKFVKVLQAVGACEDLTTVFGKLRVDEAAKVRDENKVGGCIVADFKQVDSIMVARNARSFGGENFPRGGGLEDVDADVVLALESDNVLHLHGELHSARF